MTTILIDVGKGKIAADKQTTWSNGEDSFIKVTSKIRPIKDRNLVFVGAGDTQVLEELSEYYHDHDVSPEYIKGHKDFTYALMEKFEDGTICVRTYVAKPYRSLFRKRTKVIQEGISYRGNISFGSGGSYALGAYEVSNDMVKAINAAIRYDKHSGLGVDVYSIKLNRFLKVK